MPLYLGFHVFPDGLTEDEIKQKWATYQESAKKHGAEAWKLYYSTKEARSYCVTEAESADIVNDAHNTVGLPTVELHEVEKMK